jgi:thiaminase/transcriptional activator TenA
MLAKKLFAANHDLVAACLAHPFVQGIASGELARSKFAYFIAQDAFYLDCYARAFALGIAKSPDREALFLYKAMLDAAVAELALHRGYSEAWGIDLEPEPGEATLLYTDFLLRVAFIEDIGYLAAAVTPCYVLYAYLGQELARVVNPASPYKKWVDTYSSVEVAQAAEKMETILNRYGRDDARTRDYYRRALELELKFFEQAYREGDEK